MANQINNQLYNCYHVRRETIFYNEPSTNTCSWHHHCENGTACPLPGTITSTEPNSDDGHSGWSRYVQKSGFPDHPRKFSPSVVRWWLLDRRFKTLPDPKAKTLQTNLRGCGPSQPNRQKGELVELHHANCTVSTNFLCTNFRSP